MIVCRAESPRKRHLPLGAGARMMRPRRSPDAPMRCARCQTENPPAARFCSACGAPSAPPAPVRRGRWPTVSASAPRAAPESARTALGLPARTASAARPRSCSPTSPATRRSTRRSTRKRSRRSWRASRPTRAAIVERSAAPSTSSSATRSWRCSASPVAHRDDARSAVAAALELHRAVDDFVATLRCRPARSRPMHTGINTGLGRRPAQRRARRRLRADRRRR